MNHSPQSVWEQTIWLRDIRSKEQTVERAGTDSRKATQKAEHRKEIEVQQRFFEFSEDTSPSSVPESFTSLSSQFDMVSSIRAQIRQENVSKSMYSTQSLYWDSLETRRENSYQQQAQLHQALPGKQLNVRL
ncbi:MAG: hypothetical protein AAFW89_02190 [Bacteroidota bacterium]